MRISGFGDNPLKYTDPDGRKDKPIIGGFSGTLPLVGEINTGNQTADSLIAGTGNIWNTFASAVNAAVRYAGDLSNAADAIATMADDLIPDELSLTGSGLKEDLYVGSLFAGMNPGAITEGLQHAKNLATGLESSTRNSTLVIGRSDDLSNLRSGERSLMGRLPNQGSPRANWKQNSGILRQEMRRGLPIRDASPGNNGGIFLNAERNLLKTNGWKFDTRSNYWLPPGE
jgi:hypothetical protein